MRRLMNIGAITSILSVTLGCASMMPPTAAAIASADYGAYPANYQEIVQQWINETFFDPYSVRDLQITVPETAWKHVPLDRTYYGYVVRVSLNAKNRMGGYVGKRTVSLLIRNGAILLQEGGESPP